MRVLHVSDVMGGGVESAILAMVAATPDLDHHLLCRARSGHDTGDPLTPVFGSVQRLPADPVRAVRAIRRSVRDLFPDVVHAHSSVAGVLVRLAGGGRARVVYSPHCLAFERRDISVTQEHLYRLVERALVPRTDLLVAVAPNELDRAVAIGHPRVAYAPNRADAVPAGVHHRTPLEVVTTGRLAPQKDWRYLLHLKRYAERELGVSARWVWLGGGRPVEERALTEAGVTVTGWISREQLLARLARAQVYVHTAAWEASPVSILEAAGIGLPLAVRSIPALDSLGVPGRRTTVTELAERIAELQSPEEWAQARRESLALAESHSVETQAKLLRQAYERACETAPAVPTRRGTRIPRVPAQSRAPRAPRASHQPRGALRDLVPERASS
jgi:glycosyltransferase involved in cell wall biosynthesis